jgi:hypothetical protein
MLLIDIDAGVVLIAVLSCKKNLADPATSF